MLGSESSTGAVDAYREAVVAEQDLRNRRDAAQKEAAWLAKELADAAERRHALRVVMDSSFTEGE